MRWLVGLWASCRCGLDGEGLVGPDWCDCGGGLGVGCVHFWVGLCCLFLGACFAWGWCDVGSCLMVLIWLVGCGGFGISGDCNFGGLGWCVGRF